MKLASIRESGHVHYDDPCIAMTAGKMGSTLHLDAAFWKYWSYCEQEEPMPL
jgi:hypothetical protein